MGRIIQKIILDGEMGKVWKFITEPGNFPKYVDGYVDGKTTSLNRTGIGASYEWYGKLGPFKLKSMEKIVEWQERKLVAYTGKLFGIKFNSSMKVKKAKYNKTLLIVMIKYQVPLYLGGIVADILFIQRIVKDYIQNSLHLLEKRHYKRC